ncbi:hypothetical protein ACJX0J_014470, partial [Zea mays]
MSSTAALAPRPPIPPRRPGRASPTRRSTAAPSTPSACSPLSPPSTSSNLSCASALLAEATSALFHTEAEKRRKGVWIEIDSCGDDNQIERSSAVASEGSTVTAAASAGSTATSGTCRRAPRAGCAAGGKKPREADVIMQWFSRPQAGPATENDICAAVGDNSGTSKAIR